MRVTAVRKGYFGGKIRDAGEGFAVPDALMKDARLRPSWVEPAGGADVLPAEPEDEGGAPVARKRARKTKPLPPSPPAETPPPNLDEDGSAPSGNGPEGNGLIEALGGLPPDWIPGDITD